jgi:hypothetical protein
MPGYLAYAYYVPSLASPGGDDLREALRAYLLADLTLAGLVGTRVRPGSFAETDAMPGVTYKVVTDAPGHHLTAATGLSEARVQLDSWARTIGECAAVKARLQLLLDGWADRPATYGVEVVRAEKLSEVDLHEPPVPPSEYWLYHISMDFRVKHRTPYVVYP